MAFYNTDMLLMFVAPASLCYFLLLPPCVAATSSSIQRDDVKHIQFYSAWGKESHWQSCFTSCTQFATMKNPWSGLNIINFCV
uniref:Secreted protein n=1 Tax=Arundo donax TaxID=35708 RepID=A0A0A9CP29_ARUDO